MQGILSDFLRLLFLLVFSLSRTTFHLRFELMNDAVAISNANEFSEFRTVNCVNDFISILCQAPNRRYDENIFFSLLQYNMEARARETEEKRLSVFCRER